MDSACNFRTKKLINIKVKMSITSERSLNAGPGIQTGVSSKKFGLAALGRP